MKDPSPSVDSDRWVTGRSNPHSNGHYVVAALVIVLGGLAPIVSAGPWSQLPEAIDRLVDTPGEEDAERTLLLAENSILREAQAGRLVAARTLFDTYASLVSNLPNGSFRLQMVERRIAARILESGDLMQSEDLHRAAASWALAAELDPDSDAIDRLRAVLLPPSLAEPGQVWNAPLDGASLVFHPGKAIRIGCTPEDGACLDNEIDIRSVEITALWYESREVTNRRYRLCVEAGSCTPPADETAFDDPGRAEHPVVGVSWRQARSFARWAGRRLPTEATWERAARGEVADVRFPWGNTRRRELANVWLEPRSAVTGGTRTVGGYPSMGYGMKDMPGNVWEWCADRYLERPSDATTVGGAGRQGLGRVVRGGSWRRAVDMARVSTRLWYESGYFADDLGFRCVVNHDPKVRIDWLVRTAVRAFPTVAEAGRELDGAELEAEDRRYLERRALTLYVIEGRTDEGLVPAARRLIIDPGDPVSEDLFVRFEAEILQQASGGRHEEVRRGLDAYHAAVEENPRLTGKFASFQSQLLLVIRQTVADSEQRGDQRTAKHAAELGLEVSRDDAIFAAAVNRLARNTGATMVWPGDGKGMAWIEPQDYLMGGGPIDSGANSNEQPTHRVSVRGFWIDRTEVTNDEYRSCVQAGACTPPHRSEFFDNPNLGNHPVMWVDWFQAREYAAWAKKRLPTEAEWELAARSGSESSFPWGSSWVLGRANAIGTYRDDFWGGSSPVASFEPTGWGIYDLIGNAAEWVEDVFNENYFGAPDDGSAWYQETGLAGDRRRVVRGGGYDDPPQRQHVSKRAGRQAKNFNRAVGFRCVADE